MSASIMPPAGDWPFLAAHPSTITWRRAGDARVLTAAGYALLLQVSHPTVGAGVSEHSEFRDDPWGRLLRTLDYSSTMVYGGPRAAGEMGQRIRSFHTQIRGIRPDGRRYHALEPEAYAWVHGTLAEAIVIAHERFGRRFSDDQREQFWSEWRSPRCWASATETCRQIGQAFATTSRRWWRAGSSTRPRWMTCSWRSRDHRLQRWRRCAGPGGLSCVRRSVMSSDWRPSVCCRGRCAAVSAAATWNTGARCCAGFPGRPVPVEPVSGYAVPS